MKRNILVRGARQLLTLHGTSGPRRGDALQDLGVIEDGSVLIVDGHVAGVGPTRRIENLAEAKAAEEINASGQVVMPGFVDSHTHLLSAPGRLFQYNMGRSENEAAGFSTAIQYIRSTPAGTLEFSANRHVEFCLRHGTTTIEIKTGYGLNAPAELKMLRVLDAINNRCASVVPTFLGAHSVPPEFATQNREYLHWVSSELMPRLRDRRIAQFADLFCDPGGFSPDEATIYLDAARRMGLPIKIQAERSMRMGGAALAAEWDAVSIDGLNYATADDAEVLARSRAVATLLPARVHQGIDKQFAPARKLIEAGVAVALASGFKPSVCSTFNMQMVISLACTHMDMTAEEALSAATINGAHAVARAQTCGSLEFGKSADLVILNVSDYREIPFYFGGNLAAVVMHRGQVVYRDGTMTCGG